MVGQDYLLMLSRVSQKVGQKWEIPKKTFNLSATGGLP